MTYCCTPWIKASQSTITLFQRHLSFMLILCLFNPAETKSRPRHTRFIKPSKSREVVTTIKLVMTFISCWLSRNQSHSLKTKKKRQIKSNISDLFIIQNQCFPESLCSVWANRARKLLQHKRKIVIFITFYNVSNNHFHHATCTRTVLLL